MARLNVGIISANWGAQTHLPAWRAMGDRVEVTSICTSRRSSAEEAAKAHGVARPFWDFEAMCADPDIDIIDCGTRPVLRQKMVEAALANGKHVVNQIPFAISAEVGQHLRDAQQKAGVVGLVAASILGLPQLGLMKEMIDDGYVGEIFQVNCRWDISLFNPAMPQFPWRWFADPAEGASVTRNQGSHMLHALLHLFGPIDSVIGQMDMYLKEWDLGGGDIVHPSVDDTMSGLLRFKSGAMGQMSTSWIATDSPGFVIEVIGRHGYLRLNSTRYPHPAAAQLVGAKANPYILPTAQPINLPDRFLTVEGKLIEAEDSSQVISMARLYRGMLDAIAEGGEPIGNFGRAAEVQTIVAALYDSARERRWVDLSFA